MPPRFQRLRARWHSRHSRLIQALLLIYSALPQGRRVHNKPNRQKAICMLLHRERPVQGFRASFRAAHQPLALESSASSPSSQPTRNALPVPGATVGIAFCFVPAFRASEEADELCEVGWTLGFSDQHLADVAPKSLQGLVVAVCSNEALAAYLHVAPLKLNGFSTGALHFQRAVSKSLSCLVAPMAP
ncbi:unnamed protein product [Symbiodinium natans]|uniref:Uncharacterized protein n=1 Tax=Symbiodinium natans TaxID=878477 RepID=A0A812N2Z4_9DINO|nr:unnamed protein product [Symbiodinium natans]